MNRTIVITGASGGIGAALAAQLGRQGHRLALAARREPELNAVARQSGAETLVVPTDVSNRADVEHLRDRALSVFGRIDVWVNNAGRGLTKPVLELTDEELDLMMAVNVKSALYGMQAIAPHFIERRRGHIINISSFLGRVPIASPRSAYSAAKAALNSLTANVRVDLQRTHPDIHVSVVMPGLVTTEFATHARGSTGPIPPGAIGSPMKPQTAGEVATIVADLIDRPVAEVYTNPASAAVATRYFEDVARFESETQAR